MKLTIKKKSSQEIFKRLSIDPRRRSSPNEKTTEWVELIDQQGKF